MPIKKLHALLPHLMRPAGGGIPSFSAGKGSELELQSALYRAVTAQPAAGAALGAEQVHEHWRASWDALAGARIALIGVPLDTGAGIRRGAAYGPRAVRKKLLELDSFKNLLRSRALVDLGDLFVNPHLLHDDMLSEDQKHACREGMYPTAPPALRATLPVSALSQLRVLLHALLTAHPSLRIQLIGGDHSIAWPVTEILAARHPGTLGIVQPDAHTDLMPARLGVKYCFGTWSFHANALLGAGGKLVQLGIRQSGQNKEHWESTTGVKQYWASEIRARPEAEVIAELIAHLKARGVKQLYLSNDIDGTDESEAEATGTPAPEGLSSHFLLQVIRALGDEFELVAGDVNEVAPDLGRSAGASDRTCELAARYVQACLEAQLSLRT